MIDAQLPGRWKTWQCSFTVTNGALAKILADETPAQVVAAITGEVALPGESAARQRILTGGQRIIDGSAASTDSVAKSFLQYIGRVLTKYADMGTASVTATNVINRTLGSFITDGWVIGDAVMMFGAPTAGNNGAIGIVTGVAATTLTVNGTPWTNETMGAGFRVVKVSQETRRALPANAGNTDAIPPVQLLGGTQDPSQNPFPDQGLSLGADELFIVGLVAALSALPARADFRAHATFY